MFDAHARDLIDRLPNLPDLDPVTCRRALSRAYLVIVAGRLGAHLPGTTDENLPDDLRRMVNALESVAVFDPLAGLLIEPQVVQASAFVAAEALAVLASLRDKGGFQLEVNDPLQNESIYTAIESGLLYILGGYDINAVAAVAPIAEQALSGTTATARSGRSLVHRIVALCRGDLSPINETLSASDTDQPALLEILIDETRARLYEELSWAIDRYRAWLAGGDGLDVALERVKNVRMACKPGGNETFVERGSGTQNLSPFGDVYHLASLIFAALNAMQVRSVVHGVPPPTEGDETLIAQFGDYLRMRARGTSRLRGRPLLWPTTLEFIHKCLPGPYRDAVVSMPTGSGKSFLAETRRRTRTAPWLGAISGTNQRAGAPNPSRPV